MATPADIATRALRKLKVLGATETASAEDLALSTQSVTDAHNVWSGQGLTRWTLDTIPQEVELAYVLMSAYLAAPDFVQPQDPAWPGQAAAMVQTFVNLPTTGDVYAEGY